MEFSGCPGTRQCLGSRGAGPHKSGGWACALPLLFLCLFSKFFFFLSGGGKQIERRGSLREVDGNDRALFYCVYLLLTWSCMPDSLDWQHCLYLLILHNTYDVGLIDGWNAEHKSNKYLSMQGSDCAPCLAGLLCGVLHWGWWLWSGDSEGREGRQRIRVSCDSHSHFVSWTC